jgi:hypothetical protein
VLERGHVRRRIALDRNLTLESDAPIKTPG